MYAKRPEDKPELEEIYKIYEMTVGDVCATINEYKKLSPKYPKRPVRPLENKYSFPMSSASLKSFTVEVEQYEKDVVAYDKVLKDCVEQENKLCSYIKDFIHIESGLNTIPEKYRSKVAYRAWEKGHSGGYYEVYEHLVDLVDLFRED